jgi:TetR/AcrR family transcriptional repressor of mexJK operon
MNNDVQKFKATAPPGRPRDEGKRAAILDAGWRAFLAEGVQAASLDRIARRAGVSRVTLYSHFPDKHALFEATIRREMDRLAETQAPPAPGMSLREGLLAFGMGLMRYLAGPEVVSFWSVLAGDLRRHPVLARRFYELGPAVTLRNLAAVLAAAAAQGEIRIRSAEAAAEQLVGLWQGMSHYRLALGLEDGAGAEGLEARVAAAVDTFLAAHRPEG